MSSIIIKSKGCADYTDVFSPNGEPLRGITAIDVRIRPGGLVEATLQFHDVELDIVAEDVRAVARPPWWVRALSCLFGAVPPARYTCKRCGIDELEAVSRRCHRSPCPMVPNPPPRAP